MSMVTRLKMSMLHHQACVSLQFKNIKFTLLVSAFMLTTEHFLYDRSQEHHMSAYLQSDIPEEDEIEEVLLFEL